MTHPTKTDAELTEALATEVMEWHKALHADGYVWWFDKNDNPKFREKEFMPFIAHAHMALVRAKMREMGLFRTAFDKGDGQIAVSYTDIMCIQRGIVVDQDELRAEGLAILAAVRKESETSGNSNLE
ncbi:hypothetical protein LCGC14_1943920 [marine sediment metagenome]|uniref:Uncharacterized protein n=1 Tax=marine sediment metagenome TaxID=412755 RepID=A0A0F9G7W3_9ZZZZ